MWFSWVRAIDCVRVCVYVTVEPSGHQNLGVAQHLEWMLRAIDVADVCLFCFSFLFSLIFRSFSAAYRTYETAITRVWHYSWNEWYGARKRWRMKEYTLFQRHKCMCACVSERAAIDWFSCTTAICMKWAIIHHQATSVMRDTHITILRQNDMSSFFFCSLSTKFFSSAFTQKH